MAGAGKTSVSSYFRDKYRFGYLRFGDVVEQGARELGGVNEQNERTFREQIRKELGMKAMAVKAAPLIKELFKTHENIVIDGIYSWEEYEYLRQEYPKLLLLLVYATPTTRYRRLANRPIRPLHPEEARSRDIAELINLHKGGPIALADFLVVNEGSLDELHKKLDDVLSQMTQGDFYHG